MFQKVISLGDKGSIVVKEEHGIASIELVIAESAGGGSAEGVAKVSASAKAEVGIKQLIDLGLDLAKSKFPAAAGLIDGAKVAIDSELDKL